MRCRTIEADFQPQPSRVRGVLAACAEQANHKLVVVQREPCAGGELVGDAYICPPR
jgi:hypothetical protein